MIFKIGQFRKAHEGAVKEMYVKDGVESLSLYCACSLCPVLAAYWFCRELDPNNLNLTKRIEGVKIFYGIEGVEE